MVVADALYEYVARIVSSTRAPEAYGIGQITPWLNFGLSPRASISLLRAAKVEALLNERDYVLPQDIKTVATMVLCHRLSLSFEAIADNIRSEDIVQLLLDAVPIP
jgi:MoxR-like ATPase